MCLVANFNPSKSIALSTMGTHWMYLDQVNTDIHCWGERSWDRIYNSDSGREETAAANRDILLWT